MNVSQSVMVGLNWYTEALDLSEEVGEEAPGGMQCGQPVENTNTTNSQLLQRLHIHTE